MLAVIALGGSVLLRRGEPLPVEDPRATVRVVAEAIAAVAREHQVVIAHGSGPQIALLAVQGAAYAKLETYPLDVLGAQREEMIGYLMEQELGSLLPLERPLATVLTTMEVDVADPALQATPVGPLYVREEAERLTHDKGWVFKAEGDKWRRVVASLEPRRVLELWPIKWLLERNTVVIALGGGGIPTMKQPCATGRMESAAGVIDTDLASGLLARELGADRFVMLTATDAVYVDWGRPNQKPIRRASPAAIAAMSFAADSIGSKIEAARRFATATGNAAAIGAPGDLGRILDGEAGTTISVAEAGIVYASSEDALAADG